MHQTGTAININIFSLLRYKMLLEDVIKSTPECHPDKTHLRRALTEIDAVAWHINDQLKEHENGLKVLDIQRSLQVTEKPMILKVGQFRISSSLPSISTGLLAQDCRPRSEANSAR